MTKLFLPLGILPLTDKVTLQKKSKMHLLRLFLNIGLLVFLVTSHLRIARFRRHYNNSYFSNYRQNIATKNQTFTYAFLKCSIQIAKAINYMTKMVENFLYIDMASDIAGKNKNTNLTFWHFPLHDFQDSMMSYASTFTLVKF